MLSVAGLSPSLEAAYRMLVSRGSCTVQRLATDLAVPVEQAAALCRELADNGLATRTAERPPHYLATAPDIALEPALVRHEQELQVAKAAVRELLEQYRANRHDRGGPELVEVVVGGAAVLRRFDQLQRRARTEVLALVRPPFAVATNQNVAEHDVLSRGVHARAIYDRSVFDLPGELAEVEEWAAAGEESRVLDGVPVKAVIVDRTEALMPLSEDVTDGTFVVVHGKGLLAACIALFELLWERATPLPVASGADPNAEPAADVMAESDRWLVALLLGGMTDEAAARHLGIGVRTLQRRVRALMDLVGAKTRMQLGWHAAARGWLVDLPGEACPQ